MTKKRFPRKNVVKFDLKHIPTAEGGLLPNDDAQDEQSTNDEDIFLPVKNVRAKQPSIDHASIGKRPGKYASSVSGASVNTELDRHFDAMFEREYADDTEIGALDLNTVQGDEELRNLSHVRSMIKEVKKVRNTDHGDDYEPEIVSDHHIHAIIGDDYDSDADSDLEELELKMRENRIDCESVLTYNSTLYNHPKLIVEPRRHKASEQGADTEAPQENRDTNHKDNRDTRSMASTRLSILSKLSIRPLEETVEEKRERKKALRQFRHERRQERKANQSIFKNEAKNVMRQQAQIPAVKLV